MTRENVLNQAVDQCMKELYSYAYPKITWEEFVEQNKSYLKKEKEYNKLSKKLDFCGYLEPKPFEFYYLPKEILKDITDSYIYAYKLDSQENLLTIIDILKDYCKNPVVSKWNKKDETESLNTYEHPDNLETQLYDLIPDTGFETSAISENIQNKFFEFLDMAGKFFKWNRELNFFNMSIYLGASPSSNKESVIKNWKKYRNKDIEINDKQIKLEYYGEDYFDE